MARRGILRAPAALSLHLVCTPRAAVQEANALEGADTIRFAGTVITLTRAGAGEDAAATGDLDITDTNGALTIEGNGAGNTIAQAM